MALRVLDLGDVDSQEEGEDQDDTIRSLKDLNPARDLQDMDFADEDSEEDERNSLWPEDDPAGTDPDADDQDSVNSELPSDDLAPYPIVLNLYQRQCAQALKKCAMELHSSPLQLLTAYHALVLSIFTTHSDTHSLGPLHSLTDSFVISTSIDNQGRFSPPHLISPRLARMMYAALFSMLTEVLKALDPYQ